MKLSETIMCRTFRSLRFVYAMGIFLAVASAMAATELGIHDARFTVNGEARFLLGMSYYAALGASDRFIQQDLDDMQRDGFNWIRVFANWTAFHDVSAIESDGSARELFLGRLEKLVKECERRGMIVDVTLAREANGKPPRLATEADHLRAVETVIMRLQPWRNWYLDLANEREVKDSRFVSQETLKHLRDKAAALDPRRLVVASDSSGDEDFLSELQEYLLATKLDFVAPHRERSCAAAEQTASVTRRCLERMREIGRVVPVQYQEPFRRGYQKWQPEAEDFFRDLRGAIEGGAAGWCFHNGSERSAKDNIPRRSFDLGEQRLYAQFDQIEQTVVRELRQVVNRAVGGAATHP